MIGEHRQATAGFPAAVASCVETSSHYRSDYLGRDELSGPSLDNHAWPDQNSYMQILCI